MRVNEPQAGNTGRNERNVRLFLDLAQETYFFVSRTTFPELAQPRSPSPAALHNGPVISSTPPIPLAVIVGGQVFIDRRK